MNLLETYVTNITYEELVKDLDFILYKIVADTDCYGCKEYNKTLYVHADQYKSIKEKGYYLT